MRNVLLLLALFMALPVYASELSDATTRDRAMQALDAGVDPVVEALSDADLRVLKATLALKSGHPKQALTALASDAHLLNDPLASLLEAEAYRLSAVQAVATAGDYASDMNVEQQSLKRVDLSEGLREADVRLASFMERLDGMENQPFDLLQLDASIYSVFMVDKARSQMFVYARNAAGKMVRVADEYIVTGAKLGDKQTSGDARTPNGVYRFVKRLQGNALAKRYGPVAFPIDYPNSLDALHHKDGYGIWMHGYADGVGRRPPQDTKGCFALPNPRLEAMAEYVKLGHSLVIVGENFTFGQEAKRVELQQSIQQAIESWRRDWTSLNTASYLQHYHAHFKSGNRDLAKWKRYKEKVNQGKSFIDVNLSGLSVVRDPNSWPEGEVVVAEFNQSYHSNNYQDVSRKRLYLARSDAQAAWRIVLEESVLP